MDEQERNETQLNVHSSVLEREFREELSRTKLSQADRKPGKIGSVTFRNYKLRLTNYS